MRGTHPRRPAAAVGVAFGGLVLGHWLAYTLGVPHAHARDDVLRATGHGYLPYATQVAVLAAVVGLAASFAARLARRHTEGSFPRDAALIAGVQCGAFLALEVGERALTGASVTDLSHGPLLAIGVGVQIAVALAGAAILRLTERAADLGENLSTTTAPFVPDLVLAWPQPTTGLRPRPRVRSVGSRAPPSLP